MDQMELSFFVLTLGVTVSAEPTPKHQGWFQEQNFYTPGQTREKLILQQIGFATRRIWVFQHIAINVAWNSDISYPKYESWRGDQS